MKNTLFSILALLFCTFIAPNTQAQTADDEAAVKAFWQETWQAFEAGDYEKMWAAYTDNATEIGPDGSLTSGKKALREGWDAFMQMVDEKPRFTSENVNVRMLTADVAVLTWDSTADIKIGGQPMGGKTRGMGVVRKINGKWFVECDAMAPVMPMPDGK